MTSYFELCYNKMRGEKIVVIFLLFGLTLGNWIQEEPLQVPTPSIIVPTEIESPLAEAQTEIEEIPEMNIEGVEDTIPIEVVPQQPTQQAQVPVVPQYNESLDPFDHHNRIPDREFEKRKHHRSRKDKRHKDDIRQHKNVDMQQQGDDFDGCLQMLMDNSMLMLIVLGAISLVLVKTCTKDNKSAIKRAKRRAFRNLQRQEVHFNAQNLVPPINENQAIDQSIRYHEAQIFRLRNVVPQPNYTMPRSPIYMGYQ